ncbi:hypothetical protein SAMN04487950_4034 [Halogranum rubrum]|uniref:Uncharacterized protein n=1 Tax=Halogranum rubrum TaxID=553466 RepID=A0A1I4I7U1_9EURY|nr:hypothetical protein SAMN04487950_4034 [Halogranum rubrum]
MEHSVDRDAGVPLTNTGSEHGPVVSARIDGTVVGRTLPFAIFIGGLVLPGLVRREGFPLISLIDSSISPVSVPYVRFEFFDRRAEREVGETRAV